MIDRLRKARRRRLFDPAPTQLPVAYDRSVLERLLRHRGPMLLLDGVRAVDPTRGRVEGLRELRANDPAFDGHFPGEPIYPGAFQVELMGQLGLTLVHFARSAEVPKDVTPPSVRLLQVLGAAFVTEAHPGATLTVLSEVVEDNGTTITCIAQILSGERIVSASAFEAIYD